MSEISQKQLEANRLNALKGGVKTEGGKEISKMNAVKHGLLSKQVLIDGEDENDLLDLGRNIRSFFKPNTEIERILTDRIITCVWRLKRALCVEKEIVEDNMKDGWSIGLSFRYDFINYDCSDKLSRYEITIERSLYKALHELQRIQMVRNGADVPAPVAIDIDVQNK
jgi:hypothetical protein